MEIVDGRRPKGLSPNHTQMIATLETQIERWQRVLERDAQRVLVEGWTRRELRRVFWRDLSAGFAFVSDRRGVDSKAALVRFLDSQKRFFAVCRWLPLRRVR